MKNNRKLRSLLMATGLLFCVNGVLGNVTLQEVKAVSSAIPFEPTIPKAVLADTLKPYKVKPGDTVEVIIPMKASNYTIRKPIIGIDLSKTSGFKLASDVVYYTKTNNNPPSITVTDTTFLKFSVYIPLSAKKGTYNDIPITFLTTNSFNDYAEVLLNQVSKLTFIVEEQRKNAEFELVDSELPEEVREGEDIRISLSFQNKGELPAKNAVVILEGYESLFKLDSSQPTYKVGDVSKGQRVTADFDLIGAKNLPTSLVQLTATVKYENEDGSESIPQPFKISLQTISKDEKNSSNKPSVRVTNVDYPRNTVAGGQTFDIIYTFTNTSKIDAKNIVVDVKGYSENGFKPMKAYDKTRFASLKAGKSKKVKLQFTAIDNISEGMKPIIAEYSYFAEEDVAMTTPITDTINIYIDTKSGLQGDLNNSVPRLMIAKYSTGEEKIMAGKIFDFSFDVLNSHSSVSADNIKATVSSADGTFSIVEGSASFYIPSLKAGETKNLTIPLKVKGDIASNGYDVNIKFEYEYTKKDVKENAILKQTTELNEALKLQVFSNDRPMLTNIRVGDGEPPKHMESTNLNFDFNNMGKSPLYNVTAKATGDFQPMNEVLIIGNVNAGEGKSWTMEVTPMMEGFGNGVLTISYEDSNGNVTSYDTAFSSEVMAAEPTVPDMQDIPNIPAPQEKKDIMPMWAFLLMNGVLFIVAMIVSKNILIKKYKKKKRAEIEKEDEEL